MVTTEEALLAWLSGDVKRVVRKAANEKKPFKDKPDTSSNDDDESSNYIPMEDVSRAYVKQKNKSDKKELDDRIDAQIKANKRPSVKPVDDTEPTEAAMDAPVAAYEKEKKKVDDRVRRQQMQDSITGKTRASNGKVVKPGPGGPITDSEVQRAYGGDGYGGGDVQPLPPEAPKAPLASIDLVPKDTQKAVEKLNESIGADTTAPVVTPPADTPAPTVDPLSQLDIAGSPGASATLDQPAPVPSFTPPIEDVKPLDIKQEAVPAPVRNDALSNLNIGADGAKEDAAAGQTFNFNDLSKDFTEAANKDISIAGIPLTKGSTSYEIANTALGGIQSANAGLVGAPLGLRRLGAYLYKPQDMLTGSKMFEAHNQTTDQMQSFVDSFGVTKEPTNIFERAMYALGASTLPIPGGAIAKTASGTVKQLTVESILPGTFIRPGASLAATYAASVPATAILNEGLHQTLTTIDNLRKTNPPVPNSQGDVEPRVTSVDAKTAKELQGKIDKSIADFVPVFAQASYGESLIMGVGGAVALYGLARGIRHIAPQPVGGRTIVDPANPRPEARPISQTTAGEAIRTQEQDSTHIIENQLARVGANDASMRVSTSTRSGLDARIEHAQLTGAIETPNFSFQLTTSPKALKDFHINRPQNEQADLSWALHTMDQVDHATINPQGNMPAQGDVARAQSILAQPNNQTTVQALAEMRIAQAEAMHAAGIWDRQTTDAMLNTRPNYVHNIGTGDYVVENGVSRPMTRREQLEQAMRVKTGEVAEGVKLPEDLSPATARSRVFKPTQSLDAVFANQISLEQTVRFAYENQVRRETVQALQADPVMARSISPQTANQRQPVGTGAIKYFENGQEITVNSEPMLAKALEFAPYSTIRWLSTGKNILQYTTTGPLAPWFGFASTALEMSLGSTTRLRGSRLGYLDETVQAVTGGRFGVPGDLLGVLGAVTVNAGKAIRTAQITRQTQALEQALLANPTLDMQQINQQFGGRFVRQMSQGLAVGHNVVAQDLIDNGRRQFNNTPKGIGLQSGALHSSRGEMLRGVNDYDSQTTKDAFLRSLGNGHGHVVSRWWDSYIHGMGDFHDLTKLAYIDQNRNMNRETLAYETRRLSGDLGKRGLGNRTTSYELRPETSTAGLVAAKAQQTAGGLTDFMRDGTRYYNPHMQGITRFMESMVRQPGTTLAGVVNSVTIPMLASLATAQMLGPEYVDYLMNKREEYKKTNYIYMPIPGRAPEDGLNFRIDPVLTVFGYPVLEALDAVVGIRKPGAPDAETQGIKSAAMDALKEYIGLGAPWPIEMGLAANGIAMRNVADPSYSRQSERLSGAGGSGANPASALSVPMQMVLENLIGSAAQTGLHALDAYVSTDNGQGYMAKMGNAFKQGTYDTAGKFPVVGGFFGGNRYNESGTALAGNSRQTLSAAKKIELVWKAQKRVLQQTTTENKQEDGMEVPNVQQGYPGYVKLPPKMQKAVEAVNTLLSRNGEVGGIISERRRISNNLAGLRAVNAGNIGRHVIVPLRDGAQIGGLNYMIVHKEKLKEESIQELAALDNPNMNQPKKNKDAEQSKKQRLKPIFDAVDGYMPEERGKKLIDPRNDKAYKVPTLNQVNDMRNALNKRRYALDLRASSAFETMEKQLGFKFTDIAKQIQLDPSDTKELVSDTSDD